jgi:hypothetical protein
MGKSKSWAQQIADLEDSAPKGMPRSYQNSEVENFSNRPQISIQKMAMFRGATRTVDLMVAMMDLLELSTILLLGKKRFNLLA